MLDNLRMIEADYTLMSLHFVQHLARKYETAHMNLTEVERKSNMLARKNDLQVSI